MDPADRIRHSLDKVNRVLRESEALVGDFRQTIERSWRVLEKSYTILNKAARSSGAIELENENALKKNRRFSKMIFIPCLMNSQELFYSFYLAF